MITPEELSIPGFGPKVKISPSDYAVRVLRADISDMGQLAELEIVLTRGLEGKDIVIVDRDKYTFMDKYFVVVTYWEKRAT